MSRFGTCLLTQKLVKQHLLEARIRIERKDVLAAVPHLLAAVETQRTTINNLVDIINHPRKRKVATARRPC